MIWDNDQEYISLVYTNVIHL